MYPVSDEFLSLATRRSTSVTRAYVLSSTLEDELAEIDISEGDVVVDYRSALRRSGTIKVDNSLFPTDITDALHPMTGNCVRIEKGFVLGDGTEETVPVGHFTISRVERTVRFGEREVTVELDDLAAIVARRVFLNPFQTLGTSLAPTIDSLLRSRWPDIRLDLHDDGIETSAAILGGQGDDPWRAAVDIAISAGYDLAFDADGFVRLKTVPSVALGDPVVTYGRDVVEFAPIISFDQPITLEGVYSGIVVVGNSTNIGNADDSPRYVEWDDDPLSPTSRFGPLGDVPFIYTSRTAASDAQCEAAGAALMRRMKGSSDMVTFEIAPNPAHDVGDVVRVSLPEQSYDATLLIDRLSIPLGVTDPMTVTARTRTEPQ